MRRSRLRALALAAVLALAAAPAAAAETQRAAKPFRLGFVGSARVEAALDRIEPFRRRLADRLDLEVRAFAFADEPALIEAVVGGRIDYAPLSAGGYATALRRCDCVEPLVVARAADGSAAYRAIVVARNGGPITTLADLAGRNLAVAPPGSIAGRRLPLRLLEAAGLVGDRAPRPVPTEGPAAAVRALLSGRAEAAVAWSSLTGDVAEGYGRGTLHDLVASGDLDMSGIRVVWTSPELPHGPHVIARSVDEAGRRRLRELMTELDEVDPDAYEAIEPVHSGGFIRIGAAGYEPFFDLVTPATAPAARPDPATTGALPPP